jgi:branched-chain amino acid transport system permease protein
MKRDYLILASVAILTGILPTFIPNDYYLSVMVIAGIHAMVVVGLVMLMGYAGQVSMGQAAFWGVGAYASAFLTTRYRVPPVLAIVAACALTALLAYLVGRPSLKLKGHYLAMATLALGEIVHIVMNELDAVTGGPSGMSGIPRLSIFGWPVDSDRKYYFVVWALLMGVLAVTINLIHSRIGRALRAIHGSERAARAMGVDVSGYKCAVFTLSAIYAALAGGLYAHFITFISPNSFSVATSVSLVSMAAVGGLESVWGGILGASVLTILPEYLRFFRDYDILVYGCILMLIMIFMPEGLLIGIPRRIGTLFLRGRR